MSIQAGLPSLNECLSQAEQIHSTLIDGCSQSLEQSQKLLECVKYYLLSSSPETGLEVGLKHIKCVMKESGWTADNTWNLVQLLGCIRVDKLQQQKLSK